MTSIGYKRLSTGPDGRSRIEEGLEIDMEILDFSPPAPPFHVSSRAPALAYVFLRIPVGFLGDWHVSPERQWIFCLQGEMEYEAGDGTRCVLSPGSYMLTEDTTGQGHRSRVTSALDALLLALQLEP